MRVVLALLAIVAVSSCQTTHNNDSGNGSWPTGQGVVASPAQVQSDVAAIVKGMEQARVDALHRAAGR